MKRGPRDQRRYPFDALAVAMGTTVHGACVQLQLSGSTYKDYRDRGLTALVADRLAIAAGLHPACVWDSWVDDGLSVLDDLYLEQSWRTAWLWHEENAA